MPSVKHKKHWFSRPVKQYTCLQTTQCKVHQPTVGEYHFTHLSKVNYMYHFKTYLLYTHESLKKTQVHNTNHVFTYIQNLRCYSHHWTPHTYWDEPSKSVFFIRASTTIRTALSYVTKFMTLRHCIGTSQPCIPKKLFTRENKEALLSN